MHKMLFTAALVGACAVSFGADTAQTKADLQKIENKIVSAMKSDDMAYLKGILTDDFKVTDKKKTYTKTQWVDITTKTLKQIKIKSISLQIVSIKLDGKIATLQTKSAMEGSISSSGKPQVLIDKSSDEETWVKTANGWKFKKDVTLSETATLDGKPIQD